MSTDALRLADALEEKDYPPRRAAAAELRRLHEENERLKAASTAPRQWVGLTDEQINQYDYEYRDLLYDAEKMLRENNA
jgi:hypothetical protein